MNNDVGEELNDTDETPIVTLGELLRKNVSIATLAIAIEKPGIYGWDRYGSLGRANEAQRNHALDLLAKQFKWMADPSSRSVEDPRSPLELSEDFNGPFGSYGWPADELPDFEAIGQSQIKRLDAEGEPVKRKAPDKFVVALIKLLVEIAKRDKDFDVTQMPGTKSDFYALAIKFDSALDHPIGTFETYIKGLICFKPGSRSSDCYKKLFSEYF